LFIYKEKVENTANIALKCMENHRLHKNPNGAVARIREKPSGINSLFKENPTYCSC